MKFQFPRSLSRRSLAFIALPLVATLALVGVLQFSALRAHADTEGADPTPLQEKLFSGFITTELSKSSGTLHTTSPKNYFPNGDDGCSLRLHNDVKVNQNCLNIADPTLQGRSQAQNETSIAQDPFHTDHLVASYNDYRRGDGTCGTSYSRDGGHNWTDSTAPNGFTSGAPFGVAREYWQAGGDTSVAWDTKGNAYLSCQVFERGFPTTNNHDQSSAFLVFRSTGNFGASWNFPGRYVAVVDNPGPGQVPLLDKQLITVDNHVGSPFQDRVYVTWTLFAADGTANIYEAFSADYGETFSAPHLVSGSSSLCPNSVGPSGNCDANQFSQPFTGPDGALYVTWANFNNAFTAPDNRNQMLLAKSTDGGNTFSAPVKVADYYDLPDCATYQGGKDAGRACVPEKGSTTNSFFRATNYPSGAVNPKHPSQVVVTFGSYINKHSKESNGCAPAGFSVFGNNDYTGVKTAGACNNDILVSVSNNGGGTFTGTTTDPRALTTVTGSGADTTDQFWQWAAFTRGGVLATSYYDRRYGTDETTGFSDISLSGSEDLSTFGSRRVTGASMAPPTEFGGVFFGDYAGLAAAADDAHPFWSDTRDPDLFLCPGTGVPGVPPALCTGTATNAALANDQDVFTAELDIPTN